jgi:Fe-S-cluster-containing dehydrogenase component
VSLAPRCLHCRRCHRRCEREATDTRGGKAKESERRQRRAGGAEVSKWRQRRGSLERERQATEE